MVAYFSVFRKKFKSNNPTLTRFLKINTNNIVFWVFKANYLDYFPAQVLLRFLTYIHNHITYHITNSRTDEYEVENIPRFILNFKSTREGYYTLNTNLSIGYHKHFNQVFVKKMYYEK